MNLKATFTDRGSTSHSDPTSRPRGFTSPTKQKPSPPCFNLCNLFCPLRRENARLMTILCLPSSELLIKQKCVCISLIQRRVHHYFWKDAGGSKGKRRSKIWKNIQGHGNSVPSPEVALNQTFELNLDSTEGKRLKVGKGKECKIPIIGTFIEKLLEQL